MSRNRMKNSQSLHWMGVVKWVLISCVVAGLGLVYMLCKNQNLHLAAQTLTLQKQLATIEKRNKELNGDLESLKTIKRLTAKLKEVHSDLVYVNDPSVTLVLLEQNPHAFAARMGTAPKPAMSVNSTIVTSVTPAATR